MWPTISESKILSFHHKNLKKHLCFSGAFTLTVGAASPRLNLFSTPTRWFGVIRPRKQVFINWRSSILRTTIKNDSFFKFYYDLSHPDVEHIKFVRFELTPAHFLASLSFINSSINLIIKTNHHYQTSFSKTITV